MAHRVPERLDGLTGKGPAGPVCNGTGNPDWQALLPFGFKVPNGLDRRLAVQRVRNCLDDIHIHAALIERRDLVTIGFIDLIEGHRTRPRIIHIRRHGEHFVQRAD